MPYLLAYLTFKFAPSTLSYSTFFWRWCNVDARMFSWWSL